MTWLTDVAWGGHSSRRIVPLLATVLCGAAVWYTVHTYYSLRLPDGTDERVLVLVTLRTLPERRGGDVSVVVDYVDARADVAADSSTSRRRARLLWHGAPALQVGETWELVAVATGPGSFDNPGSGYARRGALRERIHAHLRVLQSRLNRRVSRAPPGINALRERIAAAMMAGLTERDSAALATALAIGDTRQVSAQQWRIYNATGITHLVAISGMHVTLFSLLISALARQLWRLAPWLQRWRCENFAAASGVLTASGYAALSGFSVPTQRTLIMLAVWHMARGMARNSRAAAALSIAAVLVLLIDPLAPLGAGFWLSFIAVAVLIHATPANGGGEFDLRALWQTQWRVAAGLLPVTLAVFGSASLVGLAVNLVAIPVFSLLLVPLLLAATAMLAICQPLASVLLQAFAYLHGWIWPMLAAAADFPMAIVRLQPSLWWYGLAGPAVLLGLLPWRWPLRISALLTLLPAIWPHALLLRDGEYRLTALDVGRSQAVLVQTPRHALLFDNGESWGSDGAMTRSVVMPALRALGVRRLDAVIIPMLDNDRSAGLVALAAEWPLLQLHTAGADPPPEFAICVDGAHWQWDGVDIETVSASCALRVSIAGAHAVLLAAPLNVAEQFMLVSTPFGHGEVIIVPRGGAASADSAALRATLGARYAIVSNSRRGAAARTVQGTMTAWRHAGAMTLLTGEVGAIEVTVDNAGLQVHTRR